MEMGNYIRLLRRSNDLTQTELGAKLDPPVSKASVANWENGKVGNIKRNHIEQMAKIFNVSPVSLMCIDDNPLERYSADALEVAELYMLLTDANKGIINVTLDALLQSQQQAIEKNA